MAEPEIHEILNDLSKTKGTGTLDLDQSNHRATTALSILLLNSSLKIAGDSVGGVYFLMPALLAALQGQGGREKGEEVIALFKGLSDHHAHGKARGQAPLEYVQPIPDLPGDLEARLSMFSKEEKQRIVPGCIHNTLIFKGINLKKITSLEILAQVYSLDHEKVLTSSKVEVKVSDVYVSEELISIMVPLLKDEIGGNVSDKDFFDDILKNMPTDVKH